MNIIEAFDAVKVGSRVRHVLSGSVVAINIFGSHFSLCWRDTGEAVSTNDETCKDDAFEVIEPTWKKATLREAFAALVAGRTVSSDPYMLGCEYHLTNDDVLIDGYGDKADVWSDEFQPGIKWYILEEE